MQPAIKNDLLYLLRILEASQKLKIYTSKFTSYKSFYYSNDQLEFNASLNQLVQMGEQAKKISSTLTDKYHYIEWPKIKGFRNRIVHEYIDIDTENVFHVIQNDVPELCNHLITVIKEELLNGNFESEEYEIAKTSPYLTHVDFTPLDADTN